MSKELSKLEGMPGKCVIMGRRCALGVLFLFQQFAELFVRRSEEIHVTANFHHQWHAGGAEGVSTLLCDTAV